MNIGAKEGFPGFDVMLYHGMSLIYYAMNVPSIRAAGGMKRTDLILKYLMQRRHLSPSYGASQFVPCIDKDPLIIQKVPDFLVTGHIHRLSVSNYRNVTLINAGCWNGATEDQEKRGIEPQPAKLPIINLKTRQVHLMNFLKSDKKETGILKDNVGVKSKDKNKDRNKDESKNGGEDKSESNDENNHLNNDDLENKADK